MNKAEAKKIYESLDPTNEEKLLDDLSLIEAYHKERSNWTMADGLRATIPPVVYKMFSEDVKSILVNMGKKPENADSGGGDGVTNAANEEIQNAVNMAALELFGSTLVSTTIKGKTLYTEIDSDNNCTSVTSDRGEYNFTLQRALISHMVENPVTTGEGQSFRLANDKNAAEAINYVLKRVENLDNIPIYSLDPEQPAYYHPYLLPEEGKDWSAIEGFWKDCISDPEALAAWLWGVYTNQYKGRQIPYVTGPARQKKSLMFETIGKALFGIAFGALSASDLKSRNQFFMGSLVNQKFTIIPDNSNPLLFHMEAIKMITSGDTVRVEYKNNPDIEYKRLETNILVISNYSASFSSESSATSRAMPIQISNVSTSWTDKDAIIDAIPGFLAYAMGCWERTAVPLYNSRGEEFIGYEIAVNDATKTEIRRATERFEGEYLDFFNRTFSPEVGTACECSKIRTLLRNKLSKQGANVFNDFCHFMGYKYGIYRSFEDGVEVIKDLRLLDEGEKPTMVANALAQKKTVEKSKDDLDALIEIAEMEKTLG